MTAVEMNGPRVAQDVADFIRYFWNEGSLHLK